MATAKNRLPSSHFKHDKARDGWMLLQDVTFTPPNTTTLNDTGIDFLRDSELHIGEKRDKVEIGCNQGQAAAEWLVEKCQHLIPESLRDNALLFTETIWFRTQGNRAVARLDWYTRRHQWMLSFQLIGSCNWRRRLERLKGSP